MKAAIYGLILMCMMSLAGCGDSGNVPKLTGSSAGAIMTSTDQGKTWQNLSSAHQLLTSAPELNNVTCGRDANGDPLFVAVGAYGAIFTSSDGINWTNRISNTVLSLYGVTYGNGLYVAVGGSDTYVAGVIITSSDYGQTWKVLSDSAGLSVSLNGVTYANNKFVAVGNNAIMTSTTGAESTWNSLPTQPQGITAPTVDLFNVAYGNDTIVTVGTYNTSTSSQEITYNGLIATSTTATDGSTSNWNILPYTPNYLSGVTYGGGRFVAVGREGSILTSPDGTTWTPQTAAPIANSTLTPYLISVIYSAVDSQYVAVGNYVGTNPSTGFILTSYDGKTWNMAATTPNNLYGISYNGVGTYVAVGGQ